MALQLVATVRPRRHPPLRSLRAALWNTFVQMVQRTTRVREALKTPRRLNRVRRANLHQAEVTATVERAHHHRLLTSQARPATERHCRCAIHKRCLLNTWALPGIRGRVPDSALQSIIDAISTSSEPVSRSMPHAASQHVSRLCALC